MKAKRVYEFKRGKNPDEALKLGNHKDPNVGDEYRAKYNLYRDFESGWTIIGEIIRFMPEREIFVDKIYTIIDIGVSICIRPRLKTADVVHYFNKKEFKLFFENI